VGCAGNAQSGGLVCRGSRKRYELRNLVSYKLVAGGLLVPDELVLEIGLDLRGVWRLESDGTRQFPETIRPLRRSHLQINDAKTEMRNRVVRIGRQDVLIVFGSGRIILQ